jgi:hypothetical protein
MAAGEIDLWLMPQRSPSLNTLWVQEEAFPASWPVQREKLSLFHYSGQAVARSVRIGNQKLDQFSSASIQGRLPTLKSETLLRSIPLFEELELYEAEFFLVSIRKMESLVRESNISQDVASMSEVQKGSPVYIVFVESWSDSELANILAQTPVLVWTPEYIIFKRRFVLRSKSLLNEHITLLLFGYMTEKR